MKKIIISFIAIALLIALPITAVADGEKGASPSSEPTDTGTNTGIRLSIDNANIYDGMDKAYKDGYTPSVKDGIVTIVLPLISNADIKGNTITAAPGLGEPASSPFVFKNYQKTVNINNNLVSGGTMVSSYLVRFGLALSSGRTNGVYPVTIVIQAQETDGSPIEQSFTTYVTITDGKVANASASPAPSKPSSQPKVIVSNYTVNPSPAVAGDEFTATVTLENTSKSKAVQNMTVTVSCDSQNFSMQNDSNTFYISKLGKSATTQIDIKYKTNLDTPEQQYNLALAIGYDTPDATPLTSAGIVQVSVSQPLKVTMKKPQIAAQVNAGDTMPLAIQVMNMGRSKVYNVRCDLSAPGLIPTATAFIGNMEAGTAATGNMDVFIGTKDMTQGYTGTDKYGATSGKLTLTYEDAAGKQYTQDMDISTTINEPVITEANTEQEHKPETASQWWISATAGILVIAVLVISIVHDRKKRNRNENI